MASKFKKVYKKTKEQSNALTQSEFVRLTRFYEPVEEEDLVSYPQRTTHVRYSKTTPQGISYFYGGFLIKNQPDYVTLGNTPDADIKYNLIQSGALKTTSNFYTFWVQKNKPNETLQWYRKYTEDELYEMIDERDELIEELKDKCKVTEEKPKKKKEVVVEEIEEKEEKKSKRKSVKKEGEN